jgi:hypothetical protein
VVQRLVLIAVVVLAASPVHAGWFTDTLKGALESTGKKMAHEAVDDAVDAARSREKRAVEGSQATPSDDASQKDRTAPAPAALPDEKGSHDTVFVPGSRVLFYEDFADTGVGDFPRRWSREGPGAGGTPTEVTELSGQHFLSQHPSGSNQPTGWSQLFLKLPGKGDLPGQFTLELDAVLSPASAGYVPTYAVHFLGDGDYPRDVGELGTLTFSGTDAASANTHATVACADGELHRIAIAVDGTAVTALVDGVRVISDPQAITRPIRHVGLGMGRGYGAQRIMVTRLRLAEGGEVVGKAPAKQVSARAAPHSGRAADGSTRSDER